MNRLLVIGLLLLFTGCTTQKFVYTTANAHSHNDYEKPVPFRAAWEQAFGSIEADIFLHNGNLIVAHDSIQLAKGRTLDSLYLYPLQQCILQNKGHVYADTTRKLQLMIDIKSNAEATLGKLVTLLRAYPLLARTASLKIVISGNRPAPARFSAFPEWICFDGDLRKTYTPDELTRIEMISDNFARYSRWKGTGEMPEQDRLILQELINKVHALGKKIRFWNAPDNPQGWQSFIALGVDYINTDDIAGISSFLH